MGKPTTPEVIDATARTEIAALKLRVSALEADIEHMKSIIATLAGSSAPVDWAKEYVVAG